jgi:hypothetical protein
MRAACCTCGAGQPGEDGDEVGTARIAQVEQLVEDCASRIGPVRLDAGGADHLAPSLGFIGDEPAEVARRARHGAGIDRVEPCLDRGIGEHRIDFPVEPVDDLGGRISRRAESGPKRRDFLALLGGAMGWQFAARAQAQRPKVTRIGVLVTAGLESFLVEFRKACANTARSRGRRKAAARLEQSARPPRSPTRWWMHSHLMVSATSTCRQRRTESGRSSAPVRSRRRPISGTLWRVGRQASNHHNPHCVHHGRRPGQGGPLQAPSGRLQLQAQPHALLSCYRRVRDELG